MLKKTISVVVPTFNEEENIPLISERISNLFNKAKELENYNYKILFIDNYSEDSSRSLIRKLAKDDDHIQYIFNNRNFGFSKSSYYGLTQAKGDAVILLFADMQDPPELIVDFVREWENGSKIVVGIKNRSKENGIMYFIRKCYYRFMKKISQIDHIEQFTGFGLYDTSVIKILSEIKDPLPYLRGIVAEVGPSCTKILYQQEKRKHGKSSFKFGNLYDIAMLGITSYSRIFMRLAVILGILISIVSFGIAVVTFILKVMNLVEYPIGNAAILFGVYFLGGVIIFALGILGEYIANINVRTMQHPMVTEEERYNI
ncbi:MAG: glycosyltransferase family 2 protein [Acetatifactor sp.]|nr:glycosyltransferase family 2 protein [Acetatifactor sp.]